MELSSWLAFCLLVLLLAVAGVLIPNYIAPILIRKAGHWGILDFPGSRKSHTAPTPRLGGLSLMPAFWLGSSICLLLLSSNSSFIFSAHESLFFQTVLGLLIGSSGIFLLGSLDDFKRLSAFEKLAAQMGIAFVALHFLPLPSHILGIEISPLFVGTLFFTWLVIVPNSVNLLDGIDGLTSTLVSVFFVIAGALSVMRAEPGWLLVLAPAMLATLSFLRFNWRPAKLFLGDSGSLLLGFAVAYLSLALAIFPQQSGSLLWSPWISFALAFVWLMDTALAIARRYFQKRPGLEVFLRRSKATYFGLQRNAIKNICRADRNHIHHKLLRWGLNSPQAVFVLASLSVVFMALALPLSFQALHPEQSASLSLSFYAVGCSFWLVASFWILEQWKGSATQHPQKHQQQTQLELHLHGKNEEKSKSDQKVA